VGRTFARIAATAALLLALGAGSAGAARTGPAAITAVDSLETQVLAELNTVRRAHGLTPLKLSRPLAAAADAHSTAMGTHGFFRHESKDGSSFWHRVKRFYAPGRNTWSVGENLLWSTPGIGAREAVAMWMKSPGHRKNILTARWREIGLSALAVQGAPGFFGGRDVVVITTNFGVR
jgi:uncharacterized protein YkwD